MTHQLTQSQIEIVKAMRAGAKLFRGNITGTYFLQDGHSSKKVTTPAQILRREGIIDKDDEGNCTLTELGKTISL